MKTIIEAQKMIDVRQQMLKRAVEDVKFIETTLESLKHHEIQMRKAYHAAFREYNALTHTGRRYR